MNNETNNYEYVIYKNTIIHLKYIHNLKYFCNQVYFPYIISSKNN